jgi:predicted metal-dependent hydrolase
LRKTAKTIDKTVTVAEYEIPLRIIFEWRNSVRVAIGKQCVILRIPVFDSLNADKHERYAVNWLTKIYNEKPEVISTFHIEKYKNSYTFKVLEEDEYFVNIIEEKRVNGFVEVKKGNQLNVHIPFHIPDYEKRVYIRTLLSRIISKRYKKYIIQRVQYWNQMYFQKRINRITLKYNTSNWGSCSVSGNINLSTRTLLLPLPMLDYVIVHELSHLVEMNHSKRFWDVVEKVMPDYQTKETWINANGKFIDY